MKRILPSKKQWKNWSLPNKYTAIGLAIAIIIPLSTFVLNTLNPIVKSQSINSDYKIKGVLDKAYAETKLLISTDDSILFKVNFGSYNGVANALGEFNNYGMKSEKYFDWLSIYRLIKEKGNKELMQEFTQLLNQRHRNALEVTTFLGNLISTYQPMKETELQVKYEEYFDMIGKFNKSNSEYLGFIAGLTLKDFVGNAG